MLNRKLYKLGFLILVPFEISWIMSVASLFACITIGPGWVQSNKERSTNVSNGLESSRSLAVDELGVSTTGDFNDRQPAVPLGPLGSRKVRKPYSKSERLMGYSGIGQESDEEDEDEDELEKESEDEADGITRPILTPRSSTSAEDSRSHLRPDSHPHSARPSSSGSLPAYPVRSQHLPPSTMTFQEHVRLASQRSSTHLDLMSALKNLPAPPRSSPSLRPGTSGIDTLMCKSDGSQRFCRKCDLFKADRSHHCSSCKRCVLRVSPTSIR